MNIISMRCYNNVELSKRAAESALEQVDVPDLSLMIIDNGSTDGTLEWADDLRSKDRRVIVWPFPENTAPTIVANEEMDWHFDVAKATHYLGIPNDVILPKNLYREMLRFPRGIVTASSAGTTLGAGVEVAKAASENTPMAVVLIRRWAWRALMDKDGFFFDPGFFHYASDCDFALRLAACGIRGVQLDIPYYHVGSATLKNASPEQRARMSEQADKDRAYFIKKWGHTVDALEYGQRAQDINFRG